MRVTNNMMVNNLLRNLYKNYTKMDKAQQMLSSQKKFLRPSDDPIGVTKSLRLSTEVLNMQQYSRNVDDSDSWLQSSEQVVKNMMEVMQRVRELTVQASNETYSGDDRKKIGEEINELKKQIIGLGNTAYAGSYLFSGYKTDKALLNLDGTYDLDGGILSISENIFVNVGISDKMSINYIGQRIFGNMATTTYEEYVLKGSGSFTGADLTTNNGFIINYNGIEYEVTMPAIEYNSLEGKRFVEDLNTAIAAATSSDPSDTELRHLVKASFEDGAVVFKGPREFQLMPSSTNPMDVKDVMSIEFDREASLTKVVVTDIDAIDNPISGGAEEYMLKAAGSFNGITAGDIFTLQYGDYEYKVMMDRDYSAGESKEFIYDFNKKLAEEGELAELKGHLKLYEKDGNLAISADKKFRLNGTNFDKIGFEESTSGLKSVKLAHSIQGGEIKLSENPITITDGLNDEIYMVYGGKGYIIDLMNAGSKVYDGTPGNTFNDLINDIQKAINDTALKGYVSVTGNDGKIQISGDMEFKLTYGASGDFAGIAPPPTAADPLLIGYGNDSFGIKLGSGSVLTIKVEHGSYTSLNDFTKALQKAIDGDMYTRGRITVDNNGTNITFYSDLPINLTGVMNSTLLDSDTSSSSALMDSLGFNTGKYSSAIDKRVESGSATQLIGVIEKLIEDLNNNDTEGISKALTRLDININNLNAIRAEMGVKSNRLELTKNRIEDDSINIRELLSKNEDIDMAEIIMKLQMDENVYKAALSVGSKIIPLSLVDFMR